MNIIVCSLRIRRERPAVFRGTGCHLEKGSVQSIRTGAAITGLPGRRRRVSKTRLTQFGRAMQQLGIMMIPAYSPEARGRSERMFRTHQDRLTRELAIHYEHGRGQSLYQKSICRLTTGSLSKIPGGRFRFIHLGAHLENILCEHHERTVTPDNCVSFEDDSPDSTEQVSLSLCSGKDPCPPLWTVPWPSSWSEKTGRL